AGSVPDAFAKNRRRTRKIRSTVVYPFPNISEQIPKTPTGGRKRADWRGIVIAVVAIRSDPARLGRVRRLVRPVGKPALSGASLLRHIGAAGDQVPFRVTEQPIVFVGSPR